MSQAQEFRPPVPPLACAIGVVLIFLVFGVVFVYVPLQTVGPLWQRVVLAVTGGTFFLGMSALAIYQFAALWRYRLYVDSERVRVDSLFESHNVPFARVTRAEWTWSFWNFVALVLHYESGAAKVPFFNLAPDDRRAAILVFRKTLPEQSQKGWEQIEPRCHLTPPTYEEQRAQYRRIVRVMILTWIVGLPFVYAGHIWERLATDPPHRNWLMIALTPMCAALGFTALLWLSFEIDLYKMLRGNQAK